MDIQLCKYKFTYVYIHVNIYVSTYIYIYYIDIIYKYICSRLISFHDVCMNPIFLGEAVGKPSIAMAIPIASIPKWAPKKPIISRGP